MSAAISAAVGDTGAQIALIAAYTGADNVVAVDTVEEMTDITKVYKIETTLYVWNGAAWATAGSTSEAAFMLSAMNGQSAVSLKADKIDFTGFTTFLTAADVGAGGSTVIDGGRISTGTLYADSLAKVDDGTGYDYIAMQNSFDFRNPDYMNFTEPTYSPYSRAIQGLYALSFNGDTVLDGSGFGTTGNEPTSVMGYMRNFQTLSGSITQNGMDIGSRFNVRIMGQCFGNSSGGAGVILYSANPDALMVSETYFQLQVVEAGIFATKYQKEMNGSFTQLATSTILS